MHCAARGNRIRFQAAFLPEERVNQTTCHLSNVIDVQVTEIHNSVFHVELQRSLVFKADRLAASLLILITEFVKKGRVSRTKGHHLIDVAQVLMDRAR